MIILNRKESESIIFTINDSRVQFYLSEATNGQASISIDAPYRSINTKRRNRTSILSIVYTTSTR